MKLTSPYGSAEAVVDEWGYWEATMTFDGAPVGEAFTIEVAAPDGTVWAFPFIVGDPDTGDLRGDGGALRPRVATATAGPPPGRCPATRARPTWSRSSFLSAESHPVRVSVVVEGFLPTPCHTLAWDLVAPTARS